MGYDISYHPVPVEYLRRHLFDVVLEVYEVTEARCAIAHIDVMNRMRANEWGLAVHRWMGDRPEIAERCGFDPHLHVWGRPYFICETDPARVGRVVDEWGDCEEDDDCDALAARQLELLHPGLSTEVTLPEVEDWPSLEDVTRLAFRKILMMRDAVRALRERRAYAMPQGELADPAAVLGQHLPYLCVEHCSIFQPGWMDRGPVAPTMVMMAAGLDDRIDDYFRSPGVLFAPITEALPEVRFDGLGNRLLHNYSLGGMLMGEHLRRFREDFVEATVMRERLASAMRDRLDVDQPELVLRKWHEALFDAEARNMPLVEASEIYSGLQGKMN